MPIVDVHPTRSAGCEVSFVLPCLNEANSLEACIREARACVEANGLDAEIIVADNGSTDGSQEIARRAGARVVDVPEKGYGAALSGGIRASRGRYIIMGDSDMSYDFGEGMKFVSKLREGYDLVMGNRFWGGIEAGAMPPLHRYFGNPFLSMVGRVLFRSPARDFNCGLRAFSREAFDRMDVRTTGMEFAGELVIKAQTRGMRVTEVPIRLRKDQRGRRPHLRSFRDGWRNLRFMLVMSPRWVLMVPGMVLGLAGLVLMLAVAFGPVTVGGVRLDLHTLVAASLMVLTGYQAAVTGAAMRLFTMEAELGPTSGFLRGLHALFTLERGCVAGGAAALAGLVMIGIPTVQWARAGFQGALDSEVTLRLMIIGATLAALGVQTVLMSFVMSMFSIKYRRRI
jgi:hypothetical protein